MGWHSSCKNSSGSFVPSWQHMISVSLSTKLFTFSVLSTSSEAPGKNKLKKVFNLGLSDPLLLEVHLGMGTARKLHF